MSARPPLPPLLEVTNLSKSYVWRRGVLGARSTLPIIHHVSFEVARGEVLGLVGESGSGKSTIGRCVLNFTPIDGGSVLFDGQRIDGLRSARMRPLRQRMQMVFQDPYASLNPRRRAQDLIGEAFEVQGVLPVAERRERVLQLLAAVGLPVDASQRYPHEFSGGQRQRIGIARAIALRPEFIVADEPVSALDVTVRAQVLDLLDRLRREMDLSMLFISHDLEVVRHQCDRVIVLYLGRIVEVATSAELFAHAQHPYTEALLSAAPARIGERKRSRIVLSGDPPSPQMPPSGCVFRTRCRHAVARCAESVPPLRAIGNGHYVACFRSDGVSPASLSRSASSAVISETST